MRDAAGEMERAAALLAEVAAGRRGLTARVFRPPPTLAFSRRDSLETGYEEARRRAIAGGFAPVLRLGGGRAAAYHEGCVILELFEPQETIAGGIEQRFESITALLAETFAGLGLPVAVGELEGEYCPGRFSIHANAIKLAGISQRSIRGAALTAAFVAVEDGAALRDVLVEVYDALRLEWEPRTAGAAEDVLPGLTASAVEAAITSAASSSRGRVLSD